MYHQNLNETMYGLRIHLRKATSTCQFGMLTEELIRDKLVSSLRDRKTKLRLLMDINAISQL